MRDTDADDPAMRNGKSVLVLGLGDTGLSMARWLARAGARVRVADTRAAPPRAGALRASCREVAARHGRIRRTRSLRASTWSRSVPGVAARASRSIAAAVDARHPGGRRHRAVRAGARATPRQTQGARDHRHQRQEHRDRARRRDVPRGAGSTPSVAGNIGLPVLDALDADRGRRRRRPDVLVLELSSFQLETTRALDARRGGDAQPQRGPSRPLRRHGRLRRGQGAHLRGDGVQVLNRDDALRAARMALPGRTRAHVRPGCAAPMTANGV